MPLYLSKEKKDTWPQASTFLILTLPALRRAFPGSFQYPFSVFTHLILATEPGFGAVSHKKEHTEQNIHFFLGRRRGKMVDWSGCRRPYGSKDP
jgi:hypothetical protein